MIAIGFIIVIAGIAFGTGKSILDRFKVQRSPFLENVVYSTALGIAVLIYAVFILGIFGYLYDWCLWGILMLLGVVTFRKILDLLKHIRSSGRNWSFSSYSPFEKILLACMIVYGILYLLVTLSPPVRWDGIHFLFPTAQAYIRSHSVHLIPYLFAMRPKNMVMLYTIAYLLRGETLALLFNYLLTLLTLGLIYTTAKQYVTREYALLAVVMFYTMPLAGMIASGSLSESGVVLYGFLAFSAFVSWWNTLQLRWIVLAGVFSGLAAGFKVIGIEVPMIIGVLVLCRLWRIRTVPQVTRVILIFSLSVFLFVITSGIIGGTWYYLTYTWTGTPLYFGENLDRIFEQYLAESSGGNINIPKIAEASPRSSALQSQENQQSKNKENPILKYLRRGMSSLFRFGPKMLSVYAWQISMGNDYQRYVITPLYLMFIPLLLVFPSGKEKGIYLLVAFGILYFVIGVNLWGRYNRYIIPVFPVFSVIAARVIQNIQMKEKRLGQLAKFVCIFIFLLHAPAAVHAGINHFPVVFGFIEREAYLDRYLPGSFKVAQYVNNQLPETAKLLLLGEHRLFLFERECIVGGGFLSLLMKYQHFEDTGAAYQRLRLLEVTHVILNQQESGKGRYVEKNKDKKKYIETFKDKYLECIYHNADVYLYKLK